MPRLLVNLLSIIAFAVAATLGAISIAHAADPDRGGRLYETHCGNCHTSSVHSRAVRAATDFQGIRGWVIRWSTNLALGWTADDVDDVALFLNNSFYRYPCPQDVCKVVSMRATSASPRE